MSSESEKWGWKHVSVFGGFDKGSGTKKWKCNHCNVRYNGSYSRVRAHLLGSTGVGVKSCPAIDRSLREAFQILEEERLARKTKSISRRTRPVNRIRSSQPGHTCLWKAFAKEDVDDIVARFFYANGLNFNITNSPYFHEAVKAIAAFGLGYEPPSVEKLSSSLLSKERARIDRLLVPVRESWAHIGCTILCLGGSVGRGSSPHINIFVSSPRGIMFLNSFDVNKEDNGDESFADFLKKAILDLGPGNVFQIIVDRDFCYKSSETLIQSKFPHIFWSPCASHSISMLLDDITAQDWIKPIILCAKGIEKYVLNNQCSLLSISDQGLKTEGVIQTLIQATFLSNFHLVRRILELKQALEQVVISDEWIRWKLAFPEDISSIEAMILGNKFWAEANSMVQVCEPFIKALGSFDLDRYCLGDVYDWRFKALEGIRSKGIDETILKQLEVLIETRWELLFSPLHAAAYILDPRYFGRGQTKDRELMRGWKTTLERYEPNGTARRVLREQLSSYCRQEGSLGEEDAVDCRDKMDPISWWENFGSETPKLQTLAIRILSWVPSISVLRGNWIGDDSMDLEKMNNLGPKRADLVYIRYNLRLLSRRP